MDNYQKAVKRIMEIKAECLDTPILTGKVTQEFIEENPEICFDMIRVIARAGINYGFKLDDRALCPFCYRYTINLFDCDPECTWAKNYGRCSLEGSSYKNTLNRIHSDSFVAYLQWSTLCEIMDIAIEVEKGEENEASQYY